MTSVREFVELAAGCDVSEAEVTRLTRWAEKGVLSVRRTEKGVSSVDFVLHEYAKKKEVEPEQLAALTASINRWPRLNRKAEVLKLLLLLNDADDDTSELSLPTVHTPEVKTAVPAEVEMIGGVDNKPGCGEEREIRRQLSFCFQGAESDWVRFAPDGEGRLTKTGEGALRDANEQRLFLRVAELGGIYRAMRRMAEEGDWDAEFAGAVEDVLKEIQSLAVLLESDSSWPLLKINAWCYLLTNKMRAVRDFLGRAKLRGAALVNQLLPMTKSGIHGQAVFQKLLAVMLPKLYSQIYLWVTEGVLPSAGFFIRLDTSSPSTARFVVDCSCLPEQEGLVSLNTAEAILSCGKAVRFLRDFCGEQQWLEVYAEISAHQASPDGLGTSRAFKEEVGRLVESAKKTNNEKVVSVVRTKYELEVVLRKLHDYVVVGRGDFAQAVADVGGEILGRMATSIRRHELISVLDQALRMVGEEGELVLMRNSGVNTYAGDVGWDVFGVDVEMEKPISQILTQKTINKLRRVGALIWKFVHAEISLTEQWREKRWKLAYHEVWHVIHNLRAFLSYEVINHQYILLLDALKISTNLDHIILLVDTWSDSMLEGCFLMSDHLGILDVIHELLDLVTLMNDAQFPTIVHKLVALLETPKPPGRHLIFDDLHASLLAKLNFNDFFHRRNQLVSSF
jgi:gamma-tubulin complex component 3